MNRTNGSTPEPPAKRLRYEDANASVAPDIDATPTPRSHVVHAGPIPPLPAADQSSVSGRSNASLLSSASYSSSGLTRRKRKRSTSPVKQMMRLQLAQTKVVRAVIDPHGPTIGGSLQTLLDDMIQISNTKGILPARRGPEDEQDVEQILAAIRNPQGFQAESRANLGGVPSLEFVQEIVSVAQESAILPQSEAGLNCEVHSRLLRKAHKLSPYRKLTRQYNITSANMESQFCPVSTRGASIGTTRVDFGIVLKFDPLLEGRMDETGFNFSLSKYPPLQYSPLTVSIETKTTSSAVVEAEVQLNTWAAANAICQRTLLERIGNQDAAMLPHPMLLVLGNAWHLRILQPMNDNSGVFAKSWEDVLIGRVNTVSGVYQVITAIQYLLEWSAKVYLPWYRRNILDPLELLSPDGTVSGEPAGNV